MVWGEARSSCTEGEAEEEAEEAGPGEEATALSVAGEVPRSVSAAAAGLGGRANDTAGAAPSLTVGP